MGASNMSNYIEECKKRILAGNLEKPEELYPMLIKELNEKRAKHVAPWLKSNIYGNLVIDVGGADGSLISPLDFKYKCVLDKRKFPLVSDDIKFMQESYADQFKYQVDGTIIMSGFLHLFDDETIKRFIMDCSPELVVIEDMPDDFLDLRLRMWGNGRCINEAIVTDAMGVNPIYCGTSMIWRRGAVT